MTKVAKKVILCDQICRNVEKVLRYHLHNNFIQTVLESNALMKDVVKDVHNLSKTLTNNNTIIIMAEYNDFLC